MRELFCRKINKLLFFFLLLIIIPTAFVKLANAAQTGVVTATVTVQNISVTVTDGTVAFGTLANNATADTNPADTQTATNNGNITENFNIMGQNSANWTLAATAGSDQYVLKFCTASCGTPPTNYTALTTGYQTLATGITTTGTQTFDLFINTPNPSTNYTQQSVDVTVQAVSP